MHIKSQITQLRASHGFAFPGDLKCFPAIGVLFVVFSVPVAGIRFLPEQRKTS